MEAQYRTQLESDLPQRIVVEAALDLAATAISATENPRERAELVQAAQDRLEPVGVVVHDMSAAPLEERRGRSGLTRDQVLHELHLARLVRRSNGHRSGMPRRPL